MSGDQQFDFSCIHSDTSLDSASDLVMPRTVAEFANMVLWRLTSGSEDAFDECFGIGLTREECEYQAFQQLAIGLYSSPHSDLHEARLRATNGLRRYALRAWMESHHRN